MSRTKKAARKAKTAEAEAAKKHCRSAAANGARVVPTVIPDPDQPSQGIAAANSAQAVPTVKPDPAQPPQGIAASPSTPTLTKSRGCAQRKAAVNKEQQKGHKKLQKRVHQLEEEAKLLRQKSEIPSATLEVSQLQRQVHQLREEAKLLRQKRKIPALTLEVSQFQKKLAVSGRACETAKRNLRAEKRRVNEGSEKRVQELERELEAEKRKSWLEGRKLKRELREEQAKGNEARMLLEDLKKQRKEVSGVPRIQEQHARQVVKVEDVDDV